MTDKPTGKMDELDWRHAVVIAFVFGCLVLLLYTLSLPARFTSSGLGLLIAGFACAGGILPGFLFGIPRSPGASQEGNRPTAVPANSFGVNTNLEQISDWLTKIIVGVGLVEMGTIKSYGGTLVAFLASSFSPPIPGPVILAVLIYFGIFGFLGAYLWTRLYLTGEFSRAERETRDKPEFYEGLIHAYLYQPKPNGFDRAIEEGQKYVERFGATERVAMYLACAYGQQYSYLYAAAKREPEKEQAARDNAYNNLTLALQISPEVKSQLWSLWNPKAEPPEDDLKVFSTDEAFKKLLDTPEPEQKGQTAGARS